MLKGAFRITSLISFSNLNQSAHMQSMIKTKISPTIHSISSTKKRADRPLFFQPKLTINPPTDIYEQEANAMAEKVMRMTDKDVLQTKFFEPAVSVVQPKCADCEEEEREKMQRKEMNENTINADKNFESYVEGLDNAGQPLSVEVRNFYEPRFGYDFDSVRLHTDAPAARSAQSINALAYTSQNHVVFNEGQYSPGTASGKKLLAHELTHVVQQTSGVRTKNIQRQDLDEEDSQLDHAVTQQHGSSCAASDTKQFMLRNFTDFEFTVPSGCHATVTFTAIWVPVGESVDCCTGDDNYRVTRNGGTPRNLPIGANICGDNAQHIPRTGTISTGSGRQQFRVNVNRMGCEGIAMDLSVLIRIH
jgi:Domain of unknown function (DUF4157)